MNARVEVPLLRRSSNWVAWAAKMTAFLSLRTRPVQQYLTREPIEGDDAERAQDQICLNTIILYIDDELTTDISGCLTACEAFSALKQTILHEVQVRGQICNQRISALSQSSTTIEAYLKRAQSLMVEAQDIGEATYMRNLCSRVILGLKPTLLKSLGDNLMSLVEAEISAESTKAEICTVFITVVQRIRARSHMFFGEEDRSADKQEAAMFAVHQGKPPVPHATPQPSDPPATQEPPVNRQQMQTSDRICHYCGKEGHMKRNCRKFKADVAAAQKQQVQDHINSNKRPI
jgi:hypothetical protein